MLSHVFGLEKVVESGHLRFVVIDGSTVQVPGATETSYRLHIAIDLITLGIRQIEVSTEKIGENLDHYTLASGDVVLIDRGYNQPRTLVPFIARGGHVVLRFNPHSMNAFEQDESEEWVKADWVNHLKDSNNKPGAFPVVLQHDGKQVNCTVHAIPLPPDQAKEARRKAKLRSKKKGRQASENTLYLSGWVLVLTSLTLEQLNTETAAKLYRIRWQVELVIKRLKSILDIDCLRARKDSDLSDLYLHGKILYAAVTEKIVQKRYGYDMRKMDEPREITPWRLLVTIDLEIRSWIISCFPAQTAFISDALKSLKERTRKRKLQQLTPEMLNLRKIFA